MTSELTIRTGTMDDVPGCVAIIEARRDLYQGFEPRFWNKAVNSWALTERWFGHLFGDEKGLALVAERDGELLGFLIGTNFPAPPVFDPGGAERADRRFLRQVR
ncbi:MAG: N-acetyltransferase family protein [Sphingomonadales bacterium]